MKVFGFIVFVILVNIPRIFNESGVLFSVIPLLLLGLSVFILAHKVGFKILREKGSIILILFIIISSISILRNNDPNGSIIGNIYRASELFLFLMALFLFCAFLFNNEKVDSKDVISKGLILPFTAYCLLNLLLWLSNISFSAQDDLTIGKCVILSYFGFSIDRVQFPLQSGINNFASLVGGLMTITILFLWFEKKNRLIHILCVFVFLCILLLCDSRSGLISPILAILPLIIFRLSHLSRMFFKLIPYIPIIAPLLLLFIITILQRYGLITSISRESEETTTANGRTLIWSISLLEFVQFKWIHLIGYGQFGHYASGASKNWAFLFGRWKNSDLASPHNTILMMIFDYGYFGLIVFIMTLRHITHIAVDIAKKNSLLSSIVLAFLIYMVLIGTTESFLGVYFSNAIYVFMILTTILLHENLNLKSSKE